MSLSDFLPPSSPLFSLPIRGTAAATPHIDAAGQNALYGTALECSEDGWD